MLPKVQPSREAALVYPLHVSGGPGLASLRAPYWSRDNTTSSTVSTVRKVPSTRHDLVGYLGTYLSLGTYTYHARNPGRA